MEIPYTVTARPDTGLWNAKVGIWLFLASEVMLFGGLFSSYVFLRLGADYPWPEGEMTVTLGFINTLVLIASSVSVVMAWASLKMRNYKNYQSSMIFTIACALVFLVIKFFEYKAKFEHYSVTLKDQTVLAGHLEDGTNPNIEFEATSVTVDFTNKAQNRFMKFLTNRGEAKLQLNGQEAKLNRNWYLNNRSNALLRDQGAAFVGKADLLDAEAAQLLEKGQSDEAGALTKQAARLRKKGEAKGEAYKKLVAAGKTLDGATVDFSFSSPAKFAIRPGDVSDWDDTSLTFRDGTVLKGKLINDKIHLEVNEIDLRVFLKPNQDGEIENDPTTSLAFQYPELKNVQEDVLKYRNAGLEEHETYRAEWLENHPGKRFKKKSFHEFERVYLDDLHKGSPDGADDGHDSHAAVTPAGAREVGGAGEHDHPVAVISQKDIDFQSRYLPRKSPFYAIYFTMTGLHGLHVIGGAIVLGYFLIFGKSLYRKNPEHLANRVEVGGLFWHFVDLIWIFLFPIYYLM